MPKRIIECETVNLDLPKDLVRQLKADALLFNKTRDGIATVALRNILNLKTSERKKFYQYVPDKIFGRPIKNK